MMPYGTIKASPQRGGFGSVPAQGTLGLVSKVYGVFNDRDLPSTSGGQLRAIQWP